jgi:prepilin-type N-terminal cleavage/methylation domain-containing protein
MFGRQDKLSSVPAARRKGFTLIEALVAVVIVAIGVGGVVGGFGALARIETRARHSEYMQKLALAKYDEMIATATSPIAAQSGDFSDWSITDYTWQLTVSSTTVNDLMEVQVTVTPSNGAQTDKAVVTGLYYQAPTTTSSGGTTQ